MMICQESEIEIEFRQLLYESYLSCVFEVFLFSVAVACGRHQHTRFLQIRLCQFGAHVVCQADCDVRIDVLHRTLEVLHVEMELSQVEVDIRAHFRNFLHFT